MAVECKCAKCGDQLVSRGGYDPDRGFLCSRCYHAPEPKPKAGKFFLKHTPSSIRMHVHVVEAKDNIEASLAMGSDDTYRGYYHDHPEGIPVKTFGPFDTREEAEASEHAWVEDV